MTTVVQIGVGLYLVGVMTLSGLVIHYLSREPMKRSIPRAAWWSGILSALVWPFILVWLIVQGIRAQLAHRRYRRADSIARSLSRTVQRAAIRRALKGAQRRYHHEFTHGR